MARRLQAGAGPNLPSHSGNTPLHVACAAGARLPLLRLLTHARADVHARNCRDETPLHLLAMSAAFEAGVKLVSSVKLFSHYVPRHHVVEGHLLAFVTYCAEKHCKFVHIIKHALCLNGSARWAPLKSTGELVRNQAAF